MLPAAVRKNQVGDGIGRNRASVFNAVFFSLPAAFDSAKRGIKASSEAAKTFKIQFQGKMAVSGILLIPLDAGSVS